MEGPWEKRGSRRGTNQRDEQRTARARKREEPTHLPSLRAAGRLLGGAGLSNNATLLYEKAVRREDEGEEKGSGGGGEAEMTGDRRRAE
eukprot:746902-Hanusia_phi.AAC.7